MIAISRLERLSNNWILKHMPRPKKEAGSLTGSKRVKETVAKKASSKVGQALEAGVGKLKDTASNAGKTVLGVPGSVVKVTPQVVNNVTSGIAKAKQAVTDIQQAKQAIAPKGFGGQLSDTGKQDFTDPYGGLKIPKFEAQSFIPDDLTDPSNLSSFQLSEEEFQEKAALYGGAARYLDLLQMGYQHVERVGKVIQSEGKAKQSVVKGVTEQVKAQDAVVGFETAVVNLNSSVEKRDQAVEKLKQNQAKTLGAINETNQTIRLIEAKESKREADIQAIEAKTEQVISKYLADCANISLQPQS